MSDQNRKCLFCQGDNNPKGDDVNNDNCIHCGMALPTKHPQDRRTKINFFIKAFWAIVIFCIFMVFYLPR